MQSSIRSMRRYFVSMLLIVIIIATYSCGGKNVDSVPHNEITAPLDSLFTSVFPAKDAPGAYVIVYSGDTLLYARGFGLARLSDRQPMTDTTMMNICSATKTFVAAGIMKLIVENGNLSLDQPLSDFFPQLNKDVFSRITIRNVFTHSTGLPDLRPSNEEEWLAYSAKYPNTQFTHLDDYRLYARGEELTRFFEKLDTLAYEPGTRFEYLNPPYVLLANVIENATGVPFAKWLRKNVMEPAGIKDALFHPGGEPEWLAHAYRQSSGTGTEKYYSTSDGGWEEYDYGEAPFFVSTADNGLYITPREFRRWINALYSGKVISSASLDTLNTAQIATHLSNPDIQYGLGLFIQTRPGMPKKVFHSTSNGGFSIFEAGFPDRKLFYAIFANRADWNRLDVARKVDSIFEAVGWIGPVQN